MPENPPVSLSKVSGLDFYRSDILAMFATKSAPTETSENRGRNPFVLLTLLLFRFEFQLNSFALLLLTLFGEADHAF